MKYSFKLANKIRTKLLLFIDEELRTKENSILLLNKIKDNFNPIDEIIITQEESFSNVQKKDIVDFNKINNLNSSPKLLLNAYCNFRSRLKSTIKSKIQSQKIVIENLNNNHICLKKQNYFYQSYKKQTIKKQFKKVKDKQSNPKEYLKYLYRSLSNRLKSKKHKTYEKSPKSKELKKNIIKKKAFGQSSTDDNSFKIILFACDY